MSTYTGTTSPVCGKHRTANAPLFQTWSGMFYYCAACAKEYEEKEQEAVKQAEKELEKLEEETYNLTAAQLLGKHGTDFEKATFDSYVKEVRFQPMGRKMMVCHLTCHNGFEEVGTAGCEDPAKFDKVIGFTYSLKDALQKLGEKTVFARAELNSRKAETPAVQFTITPEVVDALNTHIQDAVTTALYRLQFGRQGI